MVATIRQNVNLWKLGIEPDKYGWGTFNRFEIEGGAVITKAKGRVEDPFQLEGMNGLGLAGADHIDSAPMTSWSVMMHSQDPTAGNSARSCRCSRNCMAAR